MTAAKALKRFNLILAVFSFIVWLVLSAQWFCGSRRIPVLEDVRDAHDGGDLPSLSRPATRSGRSRRASRPCWTRTTRTSRS